MIRKTKQRKGKRVPEPSHSQIDKAVDEYLKNGGKITVYDLEDLQNSDPLAYPFHTGEQYHGGVGLCLS